MSEGSVRRSGYITQGSVPDLEIEDISPPFTVATGWSAYTFGRFFGESHGAGPIAVAGGEDQGPLPQFH